MSDWQPIETAPKDGTKVDLTWMENGKPQETYCGMVWNIFAGNPFVQAGNCIWALHADNGKILMTWSDENPDGAPTHWRHSQ